MSRMALLAVVLGALLPAVAQAQASSCTIPARLEAPHPDLPSDSQPRRLLPIGGYTLAITWAPRYCRDNGDRAGSAFQCRSGNRFGFTLHGLWPDGIDRDWPQYCRGTALLPAPVIRHTLCATPSPQLLQHEWSKHGTCMPGYSPARYFARSTAMYRHLRYPDMDALSRRPLTAGALAAAMSAANPGLGADMMRVTADRQGWLDEVWICVDKALHYRRCPAHQGGLSPGASVRIWRDGR